MKVCTEGGARSHGRGSTPNGVGSLNGAAWTPKPQRTSSREVLTEHFKGT